MADVSIYNASDVTARYLVLEHTQTTVLKLKVNTKNGEELITIFFDMEKKVNVVAYADAINRAVAHNQQEPTNE